MDVRWLFVRKLANLPLRIPGRRAQVLIRGHDGSSRCSASALGTMTPPRVHSVSIGGQLKTSQGRFCPSATFAKAIVSAAPPSVLTSVVC
jgi:hypothetical protein